MTRNRLQIALEARRRAGPVIDLMDTNFHHAGLLFPADLLADWMARYVGERDYAPDPRGAPAARQAIAAWYGRSGVFLPPENLLVTASTSESYRLLFTTLSRPGDNVLLPRPGYPLFEYLAAHSHLEGRSYRLDPGAGYAVDLDSVDAAVDGRTRFIVLISPNNPTGRVANATEIVGLMEICRRRDVALITDEVFSEFLFDDAALPRPAAFADDVSVFTLNGISKMYACPDLKLAWVAATGDPGRTGQILDRLETANDVYLSCSSVAQFLLPLLFEGGGPFQRRMLEGLGRLRAQLITSLADIPGLSLVRPAAGVHAILDLGTECQDGWDDEEIAVRLLREEAVYLHPGYFYDIEERVALVLSFLNREAALEEGLLRLRRFLSRHSPSRSPGS